MEPWGDSTNVDMETPTGFSWILVFGRLLPIGLIILVLFVPVILVRLVGLKGLGEFIVQSACRLSLWIIGIKLNVIGNPMKHAGAVVANHSSWLDIFVLNAVQRSYFVSKSEVANWPFIGFIARGVGTVFIERKRSAAATHKNILFDRISSGDRLLFFPEGTSTDGRRVLPFKSTLFQAFFEPGMAEITWVQPLTVDYVAPAHKRRDWYGWFGGMGFGEACVMVLASPKQGFVDLTFHEPLKVEDFEGRKQIAKTSEMTIESALNPR